MPEIIFLVILCLYFLAVVVFTNGLFKQFIHLDEKKLLPVTVIVAARNEEKNILECIESLSKLEFPEGKLEIIIADDNSTDRTAEIVNEFISDKNNFKLLKVEQDKEITGKSNALDQAVGIAKGEIILLTDADCSVNPMWAKTAASYYSGDIGVVCGFTNQSGSKLFHSMQSIDFIYLLSVASGTMNIGKTISAIGNNLSFLKKAYFEAGGYRALKFSVTEDYTLIRAIINLKKYKLIYPLDKNLLVTSKPCPDIKTLFHQKKRWVVGGMDSNLFGFLVMFTAWFTNIMLLISLIFFSKAALILTAFKLFTDYFFIMNVLKKLKLKITVFEFLIFELYQLIYVLIMPPAVILSRKVKWKGREF